jgi:hypothetical protein
MRFFPPGFDLENFVVYDDPEFSAEPLVRAQEVSAYLRITSLLRGKVEIARLSLTEPSLNLVRNELGHWNVEGLLDRTSKITVAPTGKAKLAKVPGFPYIASDSGRINFKLGNEKTPYTLTDADFALWQDSENSWGMRLKARPTRTDFNLTDTGLLRVEGTWQRASSLRDTPLKFTMRWQDGQLGQASKFADGTDKGWRGTIDVAATVSGTPSDLLIQANPSIDDFRHFDVSGGSSFQLKAACTAHYSSIDHTVSKLLCNAPMGTGVTLVVNGSIAKPTGPRTYDLEMAAHAIPVQAVLSLLRRTRNGIPEDLAATGEINANFNISKETEDEGASIAGEGEALDLEIPSADSKTELSVERVPFAIASPQIAVVKGGRHAIAKKQVSLQDAVLNFGPVILGTGKAQQLSARGNVSREGYSASLLGDSDLRKLFQIVRAAGLTAPRPQAEGSAKVDLNWAGAWRDKAPAEALGKVQLHSVRAQTRGLNQPFVVSAATVSLKADRIEVQDMRAEIAGSSVMGSISLPRHCTEVADCLTMFDLHADQIDLDKVNAVLNPQAGQQPWYHFLSGGSSSNSYLLTAFAKGTISTRVLTLRKFEADKVSTSAELKDGKLHLGNLRADFWGGKQVGDWTADFSAKTPHYAGTGSIQRASLTPLAEVMNDTWITGWANGTYHAAMSGATATELFSSATGNLQLDAHDGSLPHIVLGEKEGPLQMQHLSVRLALADRQLTFQDGEMETASGSYGLSGTATLDRVLNFKLTRDGAPAFSITGTLTEPRVSQASTAQAQVALKP